MERTITTEKHPIKLWLRDIDADTLTQARNLANLDFIHSHVAIMPDAHVGYGMPIGGVAATRGAVIPNAVGVDIGCGICAVRTSLTSVDRETLKNILGAIRRSVPVGFNHHRSRRPAHLMPDPEKGIVIAELPIVNKEFDNALTQIGTLGGGNHFIEIQQADDSHIWIMIHSGSRNIGFRVANHYNDLAIGLNRRHGRDTGADRQLASLPLASEVGERYLHEMRYCVQFAKANRRLMLEAVEDILQQYCPPLQFGEVIDVAHNYAAFENHFYKEVLVHRKGATRAGSGETGIIPGSQGSASYIVRGKGNLESFSSCSHGAGRKLGRKQAQRQLDLQSEINLLESQQILHAIRGRRDLEEAAGAYKDIEEVLRFQQDLVEVVTRLRPLAVIKG
jgi:tRNA-splicing ligase RtcB